MKKNPPQPDFLKLKLSSEILLGFISCRHPTRQEIGIVGTIPTALRYIFKRYYQPDFMPTLMGDALLVAPHHLDLHMKPQDVETFAGIILMHGYRLGEFHHDWKQITRIRADFKRANYYAPREELLGIKGEVIDMEPEPQPQSQLCLMLHA
jgi:hypothetical protein